MQDPVKLLLADSNQVILYGLRAVFSDVEEVRVIGEALSAGEMKQKLRVQAPDVVLIDTTAPGFGIETVPEVLERDPGIAFVAITADQTSLAIKTALQSGIRSYIKKDCDIQEIRDAVIESAKGKKFFCGKILETISHGRINVDGIGRALFDCNPVTLSVRETEIVRLIAEGHTNNRIAEKLYLSEHTVNTHRKNIMRKLGLRNTAEIVLYAVKADFVSPNRFAFPGEAV